MAVKKKDAESSGEFLHTKHAFPPNNLGYCGPDVRGRIEDYLHSRSDGESILKDLTRFEAAYPFIRMIAKSAGRKPFDYHVTEAYWLGNSLLNHVEPIEFFEFSHRGLASTKLPKQDAKLLFKELGPIVRPHHTFYVLGMYARPASPTANQAKLLKLMDSCRISWGKVSEVKERELIVERRPLVLDDNRRLGLSKPVKKKISYDREITPFGTIKKGDCISLHWNFASEKLTSQQVRNLQAFTLQDIKATNLFADILQKARHESV